MQYLDSDIKYLKGVGPVRAQLLAEEAGIRTFGDMLEYFPTAYVDRSRIFTVAEVLRSAADVPRDAAVQMRGRFLTFTMQGEGAKRRLTALFSDGTATLECVWFQRVQQVRKSLATETEYLIFGHPKMFNNRLSLTHPQVDSTATPLSQPGLQATYPLTMKMRQRGIDSRVLQRCMAAILEHLPPLPETLPETLLREAALVPRRQALLDIHRPADADTLARARQRLKYEELFYLQLALQYRGRTRRRDTPAWPLGHVGTLFNTFYHKGLRFELTDDQKRVVREVHADMRSGRQMNRLLQGDVGSGKTVVALLCMLLAADNGCQAALMAPTEILAQQHYETLTEMTAACLPGLRIALLTGSTGAAARREIDEALRTGQIHILVGTHALIEEHVQFPRLGLVIIDEQHRFGVEQRARLQKPGERAPHVLVMTATPIPRTLAMTVYGDLDVSAIRQLPPGRKPVTTVLRTDKERLDVYRFVYSEIRQGRQVYVVYPLITENEKLDLRSLEEGYEQIRDTFRDCRTAFCHGRMKPAEKEYQMQLFASGQAQILVATTVIEVGVNVPNASIMIIENAERFGLSQLHQLRGRVGRGADQSYCILMSKETLGGDTLKRLRVMTSTTDGFEIAEHDLQMRGPGDVAGTAQSGMPVALNIASLARDGELVTRARRDAERILDADPELTTPDGVMMRQRMNALVADVRDHSDIL